MRYVLSDATAYCRRRSKTKLRVRRVDLIFLRIANVGEQFPIQCLKSERLYVVVVSHMTSVYKGLVAQ